MPDATVANATIRPEEAAHFAALAKDWWDPKGSSAMLHRLNPVRLGFIREAIDLTGAATSAGVKLRSVAAQAASARRRLRCGHSMGASRFARLRRRGSPGRRGARGEPSRPGARFMPKVSAGLRHPLPHMAGELGRCLGLWRIRPSSPASGGVGARRRLKAHAAFAGLAKHARGAGRMIALDLPNRISAVVPPLVGVGRGARRDPARHASLGL